jgi:hypothetical protein
MKVHVLATCRKPELAPFTELVFKTLRVGFPTYDVVVHINGEASDNCPSLPDLCKGVNAETRLVNTIHHTWIESLLQSESDPFWILDTDVIFYESIEEVGVSDALVGCRIPEWQDEFSGAITRPRLHPSLLYINPTLVRAKLAKFLSVLPDTPFTPPCNFINPLCLPLDGRMYFHDTMSLLYHAIGGRAFTADERDKFFHFNFGSIPDIVLPRLKDAEPMTAARKAVMDNPELGRGAWRAQDEYYASKPALSAKDLPVIPEIKPEDAAVAIKWNQELCCGDRDAMHTTDMWYQFCHGVDDILDTMQDGRPKMSRAQILSVFFKGMLFYNSPFYANNRNLLFPVAIQAHNMYADSVEWEQSPLKRRRAMADVMRTCGNEMFFIIALLKGGEAHMREMSPRIRDRDWLGQHDDQGRPT